MSDDRSADLVDRLREAGWQKHANNDDVLMLEAADEVKRLRYNERDLTANARIHAEIIAAKDAELVAVRAALKALVDAIESPWWKFADTEEARAVAAGVLNREGDDARDV